MITKRSDMQNVTLKLQCANINYGVIHSYFYGRPFHCPTLQFSNNYFLNDQGKFAVFFQVKCLIVLQAYRLVNIEQFSIKELLS